MEHRDDLAVAATALARGDALRVLGIVGRRDDARALLLRGIAYAQIGDTDLAERALERARRAASPDAVVRARIDAASAEIGVASGEPGQALRRARASAAALGRLGDTRNAAMLLLVAARAEVLLGRLADARRTLESVLAGPLPADVRAVAALASAEIAVRELRPTVARAALAEAHGAMNAAPHDLLARAVTAFDVELSRPVARLLARGEAREADLFDIEAARASDALVVDACRRAVTAGAASRSLGSRPVLFQLLLELARAWPDAVPRDDLAARGFGARRVNESHRARLRVEIGRVRKLLAGMAAPVATPAGYTLATERPVVMLLPPTDDEDARVAILLGDGAAWSAQALADHAGVSKRTALRVLASLAESGRAVRTGKGKQTRYAGAGPRIASRMLLLGLVPAT